jgi:hypothetical protein
MTFGANFVCISALFYSNLHLNMLAIIFLWKFRIFLFWESWCCENRAYGAPCHMFEFRYFSSFSNPFCGNLNCLLSVKWPLKSVILLFQLAPRCALISKWLRVADVNKQPQRYLWKPSENEAPGIIENICKTLFWSVIVTRLTGHAHTHTVS